MLVKTAAHEYFEGSTTFGLLELSGTTPREVKLALAAKTATVAHFNLRDLPDGTSFDCKL